MRGVSSKFFCVSSCILLLNGCANHPGDAGANAAASCRVFGSQKQTTGAILGALVGGGLAAVASGGKAAPTAIFGLLGLLAGGAIGKGMDNRDCEIAQAALKANLSSAVPSPQVQWSNPQTNTAGLFNVETPYTDGPSGRICRHYSSLVRVQRADGSVASAEGEGTTCRDPDGDWKIM